MSSPHQPAVQRPDDSRAYLRVRRIKSAWRDRIRAYRIEVDGKAAGNVRNGQELLVEVEPGRHTVRALISWTGSPPLNVVVPAGKTVTVRVAPAPGSPLAGVAAPEGYLQLTLEEPQIPG